MTDEELKAIEGLWQQEPKTGLPDMLVDVVPELIAEVRRLRGLVKGAEQRGTHEYAEDTHMNCPWCGYDTSISPKRRHAPECRAFHEDGQVR